MKKGSAEKGHRKSLKRRVANKGEKTRIRTAVRKVQDAVESKDKAAAQEHLRKCCGVLDSAATSGVIHPNAAARKKSRLSRKLAGMGTT